MEILIKSIVEKRLERLIFIRAELLKPQPSIRGEREQASLSQLLNERERAGRRPPPAPTSRGSSFSERGR